MSHQPFLNNRIINMDRAAKNCIRTLIKVANSTMAIAGLATLMYSAWMVVVCLRDYQKYHFPWFLWACIGTGVIFCLTASLGHAAADTRSGFLLSLYILVLFLLLLAESLVTADVYLNDDWDKDFPKDPTDRFDDFVDYVDSNIEIFRFLGFLIFFSQITSFLLAMVLKAARPDFRSHIHDHDDQVSVSVPIPPPYVVGHPHPHFVPPKDVLEATLLEKESTPYSERGIWSMASSGFPPC